MCEYCTFKITEKGDEVSIYEGEEFPLEVYGDSDEIKACLQMAVFEDGFVNTELKINVDAMWADTVYLAASVDESLLASSDYRTNYKYTFGNSCEIEATDAVRFCPWCGRKLDKVSAEGDAE